MVPGIEGVKPVLPRCVPCTCTARSRLMELVPQYINLCRQMHSTQTDAPFSPFVRIFVLLHRLPPSGCYFNGASTWCNHAVSAAGVRVNNVSGTLLDPAIHLP